MSVRVRIAPSPTGDPHVGTAYVALLNLIFAKSKGGRLILRIEDTDRGRSRSLSEALIYRALRWCGIHWDEGPDVGGAFGPYRQSERLSHYQNFAGELVARKAAYKCFATPEELARMREIGGGGQFRGYDRRHRNLTESEIAAKEAAGAPSVIRLRAPLEGDCRFTDGVKGVITTPWSEIDDQVLLKSDGHPTYHLANVVDDHLMEISHVIRGDEWVSSTPKHLLIYRGLGWQPPEYLHVPLLLGKDGRKLSKRRNPTSIFYYRDAGYLPEALTNFLTLMGYRMGGEREIYTFDEIAAEFEPARIGVSGAYFDLGKLNWLNQQYIIRTLTPEKLWQTLRGWMFSDETMLKLMPLCHTRIKRLSEVMELSDFLFVDHLVYSRELLCPKPLSAGQTRHILHTIAWQLDELEDWTRGGVDRACRSLAERWQLPLKKAIIPIFYAVLMGKRHGLPLFESADLLGKERMRTRLLRAGEFLGPLSAKELKELKNAWSRNQLPAHLESLAPEQGN